MSKKKSVWTPNPLADGSWQIKDVITAGPCTRISALVFGFRYFKEWSAREYFYWEIAKIFWGDIRGESRMEKNAYSERIIRNLAQNRYLAIGGCTSSGKSHVTAGWAVVCWLSDPSNTLVMVTTTTLKDAEQRVWGSVMALMEAVEGSFPVKSRPSLRDYVYVSPITTKVKQSRGIFLVSAEKKKTKEAVGRFIGKKAPNIILLADELGELSPAITHAGVTNLSKGGHDSFQLIGLSNPDSKFDAFGIWAEPKVGWEAVNAQLDMEWATKWNGKYIRLDAYDSPHIGRDKSYLPTQADIDEQIEILGDKSRSFYRMWRAVFFDGGEDNGVFTENEIVRAGALNHAPGLRIIGRGAGLDLSFTNGGDRCVLYPYEIGYTAQGSMIINFLKWVHLEEDATSAEPRSYQIANKLKEKLEKMKIPLRHVSVDSTSGGNVFCDVFDSEIKGSGMCTRVSFGNRATKSKPNPRVKKTAEEMYRNRVTEMWFVGKEFMRCKQVRGMDTETAKELTLREFDQRKSGGNLRVGLESKVDYKTRTSMPSPDLGDSWALGLDSARQNFSFYPVEPVNEDGSLKPWEQYSPQRTLAKMDVAGQSAQSFL